MRVFETIIQVTLVNAIKGHLKTDYYFTKCNLSAVPYKVQAVAHELSTYCLVHTQ